MNGNISKKRGLASELTNEDLEFIASKTADKVKGAQEELAAELKLKADKTEIPKKVNDLEDAETLATKEDMNTSLSSKVDKVSGKGLSANDYTNEEKKKLSGIADGANNYTLPEDVVHENALCALHYGSSTATPSQISDFEYMLQESPSIAIIQKYIGSDEYVKVPFAYDSNRPTVGFGGACFAENTKIQTVFIPRTITVISSNTFRGCSALRNVYLHDGIGSLASYAFSECVNLKKIDIPPEITEIGEFAFYRCASLTKVTIPNKVTKIGQCAFASCTQLSEVVIPNSVVEIGENAFRKENGAEITFYVGQGSYAERYCKSMGYKIQYTDMNPEDFAEKDDAITKNLSEDIKDKSPITYDFDNDGNIVFKDKNGYIVRAFAAKAAQYDVGLNEIHKYYSSKDELAALKKLSVPHTAVSGYPLAVTDALANEEFISCKIHGNSKKNLIPFPYIGFTDGTMSGRGITLTLNSDGSITANGTAETGNAWLQIANVPLLPGEYFLSGSPSGGGWSTHFLQCSVQDRGEGASLVVKEKRTIELYIFISAGNTVSNFTFYPMLERGSSASDFELFSPMGDYKNGKYEIPFTLKGKNLVPTELMYFENGTKTYRGITYTLNSDGSVTANGTATGEAWFQIANLTLPAGTYFLSGTPSGGGSQSYFMQWGQRDNGNGKLITLTEKKTNYLYLYVCTGYTVNNLTFYPMIEYGSAPSEYAPPYSETVTARLDAPLSPGMYIDIPSKKLVKADNSTSAITIDDISIPEEESVFLECNTTVEPAMLEAEYYQDINKVIGELKSAILAQGGNE